MITEKDFELATGHKPEQDDLDRCNCQQAGEGGHFQCGWNPDTNLPAFMGGYDFTKAVKGYYKVAK